MKFNSFDKKPIFLLFAAWLSLACLSQPKAETFTGWDDLKNPEPQWLLDAKFGIYFHWSAYTVPAFTSEWYSRSMYVPNTGPYKHQIATYGSLKNFGYKDFIPLFKAEHFNADEWADLFVRAGAKFAGPVAEHADGFSMWNSKANSWNAKQMGPKQDVVGKLEKAIRKRNLKFFTSFHHQWLWGWYPTFDTTVDAGNPKYASLYGPLVSSLAWQQSDSAEKPDDAFCQTWLAKVKEVIHQYHPDVLYFDSRLNHIKQEYRKDMMQTFFNTKDREQKVVLYKNFDLPADAGMRTYEKSRLNKINESPWMAEEPISTYSWSYTTDMELRSAPDILNSMIDIVSKNGIYLLNISPKADGTIPQEQKDILLAIGNWLQQNGEAIYNTRPWYTYGEGPQKDSAERSDVRPNRREFYKLKFTANDMRYTTKDNMVYAIMLGKPEAGKQILLTSFAENKMNKKVAKITMLASHEKIEWKLTNDGLMIKTPNQISASVATVFKIEMMPQ